MGGADAEMRPYGVHYATRGQLYNTFVKPFTDVVQTVAGTGKELSQRAQTLLRTGIESVATTFLPFLSSNYKQIFAKEKERINKIRQEYKPVYDATWDSLKDNDVAMLAFMYSPGDFLKAKLGEEAPKAGLKMLSVLSGGTLDNEINSVLKQFSGSGKKKDLPGYSDVWDEGLVREKDKDQWNMSKEDMDRAEKDKITSYLVKKAVNSPEAQKMRKDATTIVRDTLETAYKQAQAIASASNLQDLEAKIGKKIPGSDKIKGTQGPQRVALEQQLLKQMKQMSIKFFSDNLQKQLEQAVKGGVPKNSQYVQDYMSAIKKIRALA